MKSKNSVSLSEIGFSVLPVHMFFFLLCTLFGLNTYGTQNASGKEVLTASIDGVSWTYVVNDDNTVSVGGGIAYYIYGSASYHRAISTSTVGAVAIPSHIDGREVTGISDGAFSTCEKITLLTIPSSVTSIGDHAFYDCQGLTDLNLPGGVTSVGSEAFYFCKGLQSITIPSRMKSIGTSVFLRCENLVSILVDSNNAMFSSNEGMLYNKSRTELIVCPGGKTGAVAIPSSVTKVDSHAFYGCSGLTDVTISDNVTRIEDYTFYGCSGLTSVTIPHGVTCIGNYAFSDCDGLKKVTMPEGVTSIGYDAFRYCKGLTSLTTPSSLRNISSDAFYGCSGLKEVVLFDGVTNIGSYAFQSCSSLKSLMFPSSLASIGSCAFYNCSGLTTVTMPSSVVSVGGSAFYGCSGLTEVIAYGAAPSGISSSSLALTAVWFKREFAPSWIGAGFTLHRSNYFIRKDPCVNVLSSQIREADPTIMDVEYMVTSESPTVKVRALAFKNGVRSFANVVRPETFVDGTAANIGDEVAANVPHKLSWRVSADYGIELTKMKFEVIAQEGDLLPMEWIYIPKSEQYGKMKVSYNTLSESQVFDALMWLYAAKDPGLTLSGGTLRGGGYTLASGAGLYKTQGAYVSGVGYTYNYYAHNYLFAKMGWSVLSGAVLNYANSETRKGLSPSGIRQYAYQIVE